MLGNNNEYKLMKVFLDNPTESFRLRELSRLSSISPPSVMNYLGKFIKKGLIQKYEKRNIPFYKGIRDNEDFKQYKKLSIHFELHRSGLINFLWDKLAPDVIVLFGSFSKGESVERSDLDIYVQSSEKKIDLKKYEKIFNCEINLFYEGNFSRLSKELKNNIINGDILRGYLKVF